MDTKFYKFARIILTPTFKLVYRPKIIGEEYILNEGSLVLAGNHTNYLDCLLLISTVKRQIHFLGKDSLFKGILKYIMKLMGVIPVNRKIHDKNALKKAEECLKKEGVIGIFPEGTINRTDDVIMPFKIGAVKMSSDTNSILVPFIITGEYKPFRKSIKIEFLEPRKIKDDLSAENKRLMDLVSEKLKKG